MKTKGHRFCIMLTQFQYEYLMKLAQAETNNNGKLVSMASIIKNKIFNSNGPKKDLTRFY